MDVWRDGSLWERGHWVNNKFGFVSLAAILIELSNRCGISSKMIESTGLDEPVEGIILHDQSSALEAINILRIGYFFDIVTSEATKIKFIKRGQNIVKQIDSNMLMRLSDNYYLERTEIAQVNIISKLSIDFIDRINEYRIGHIQLDSERLSHVRIVSIKLPIIMSNLEAEYLGRLILKNALIEDKLLKFILPYTNIIYEVSDFIILNYLDHKYQMRIIEINFTNLNIEITSILDDIESYYLPSVKTNPVSCYEADLEIKFIVLDLPFIFIGTDDEPYIAIYLQSVVNKVLYVSLNNDVKQHYNKIADLIKLTIFGKLVTYKQAIGANIFLIDKSSKFIIYAKNFAKIVQTASWNRALCGGEIISFKRCELIGENLYQISEVIRGEFASEDFINNHEAGEEFILLDDFNLVTMSEQLMAKEINLKINHRISDVKFVFHNESQKLPKPFIEYCDITNDKLHIIWRMRERIIDDWHLLITSKQQQYEFIIDIIYKGNIQHLITNKSNINIDFIRLELNEAVNIAIIAQNQDGIRSNKKNIIL
jgi:hypothetical protein